MSKDTEDFWYYVNQKKEDRKDTNKQVVASILVYAAENIKPESDDLKALLKHLDYIFDNKYINEEEFIQGLVVVVQCEG